MKNSNTALIIALFTILLYAFSGCSDDKSYSSLNVDSNIEVTEKTDKETILEKDEFSDLDEIKQQLFNTLNSIKSVEGKKYEHTIGSAINTIFIDYNLSYVKGANEAQYVVKISGTLNSNLDIDTISQNPKGAISFVVDVKNGYCVFGKQYGNTGEILKETLMNNSIPEINDKEIFDNNSVDFANNDLEKHIWSILNQTPLIEEMNCKATIGMALVAVYKDYNVSIEKVNDSKYIICFSGTFLPNPEESLCTYEGLISYIVDVKNNSCELDSDFDNVGTALKVYAVNYLG